MTAGCQRFDEEGLPRLEAGLPLDDEHFRSCPDCLRARSAFEEISGGLAGLAPARGPRPGWQGRVMAEVRAAAGAPQAPARRWWVVPVLAGAVAVAALVFWALPRSPRAPALALATELLPAEGQPRRAGADQPRPGDRWKVRATFGGAAHAELRIFRDRRHLVARCPLDATCVRAGDTVEHTVVLAPGRYEAFVSAAAAPLPAPAAEIGQDLDTLARAGAQVVRAAPLLVW